ncbi:MAG: hypothetical protein AAF915_25390 [Cyanobacteria bacterium P01_D01_bin.50]
MITQQELDSQTLAQLEFQKYIKLLVDEIAPEFEIDSVTDDFGELYRVWYGSRLLGTFYRNIEGKWIAQPCSKEEKLCCDTPDAAQAIIITTSGLPVAVAHPIT